MRRQRAQRGSLHDISLYYMLIQMLIKHYFIGVCYYMLSIILMKMFENLSSVGSTSISHSLVSPYLWQGTAHVDVSQVSEQADP